jgi:hypothetical protein
MVVDPRVSELTVEEAALDIILGGTTVFKVVPTVTASIRPEPAADILDISDVELPATRSLAGNMLSTKRHPYRDISRRGKPMLHLFLDRHTISLHRRYSHPTVHTQTLYRCNRRLATLPRNRTYWCQ